MFNYCALLVRRTIPNQKVRFVVVGVFNTVLGYALYRFFYLIGLDYQLSFGMALLIMLVVGYMVSGHIVFAQAPIGRFWLYVAAWLLIYVVNAMALKELVERGVPAEYCPLILIPANTIASYWVQRAVIFRR